MTRPSPPPFLDAADSYAGHEGYEQAAPYFSTFGERLMDLLIREPGWDLLDVGTGQGSVASAAASRGFTVTATDSAPRRVANLRLQNRGINALLMDAHSLDFHDDSFDIATASFVIDLFEDATPVLHEVCRVVRPGGLVAVTVPASESRDPGTPALPAAGEHVDVAEAFAKAGLTDLREESIEVRLPVGSAGGLQNGAGVGPPTAPGERFLHRLAKVHLGRVPRGLAAHPRDSLCRA